ncbi:hypothetical protein SPONN_1917 [uncultured Candidatus Thioglobus sp.]|nr:hypothetical protein SPONN_1917 [uncultured Candidatus Thioglobus sp.]
MVVVDFCDCWLFSFSLDNILPKKYWALLNVQSDIYLTNRDLCINMNNHQNTIFHHKETF